jgi:hypothetical protein
MMNEASNEHRWLHRLIGEWTSESECVGGPGEPPMKGHGTESVRALGELWVLCEGRSTLPGCDGEAHTLMTLGFDAAKGGYVGHWVGSMMSWPWIYAGTLDAERRLLTLESEGPDFSGRGGLATYRDAIEFLSDDHRVLTSCVRGADGVWSAPFMTAHFRRKARAS